MPESLPATLSQERLAHWVAEHGGALRGFVRALVRRHDVVDDIVQEVFRRAWEARDRYLETGAARSWLLRIADRLVCDRARRNKSEVTVDSAAWNVVAPSDPARLPEEQLEREETHAALNAALNDLSDVQRRVLLLRYYGSLGFAEIAEMLELPLNTVLSHCRRGLLALRKRLVEGGTEGAL